MNAIDWTIITVYLLGMMSARSFQIERRIIDVEYSE